MDAGQPLQLPNQGVALFLRDKPGGLHRVHQKLQLGQLKVPRPHKPAGIFPLAALYVQAKGAQCLHVIIDAFALRLDAVLLQRLNHLRHCDGVIFIGLAQEQLIEVQQLGLLVGAFCHKNPPPFCR